MFGHRWGRAMPSLRDRPAARQRVREHAPRALAGGPGGVGVAGRHDSRRRRAGRRDPQLRATEASGPRGHAQEGRLPAGSDRIRALDERGGAERGHPERAVDVDAIPAVGRVVPVGADPRDGPGERRGLGASGGGGSHPGAPDRRFEGGDCRPRRGPWPRTGERPGGVHSAAELGSPGSRARKRSAATAGSVRNRNQTWTPSRTRGFPLGSGPGSRVHQDSARR